jgi:hypothetical protein
MPDDKQNSLTTPQPAGFVHRVGIFAHSVCSLAFPPTPTKPWKGSSNSLGTRSSNSTHSPFLRALCARIAHIAAVAETHEALAAHRFALEITAASPLVARALAPAPCAALEHPNIHALRACFRDATLRALHAMPARHHEKAKAHNSQTTESTESTDNTEKIEESEGDMVLSK